MSFNLYLTGFMTSGKSTIGPILANVLGMNFIDLDKYIESKENESVSEIFTHFGESYFRTLETKYLTELSENNDYVIALGGGSLTSEFNYKIIHDSGYLIYLKTDKENLYKRLRKKIDRPLFKDMVLENAEKDVFIERISKLLEEREKFYNRAEIIIDTDKNPIGITVDKLVKKLKSIIDG